MDGAPQAVSGNDGCPRKVSQTNPGMNIRERRAFAAFSAKSDFTWRGQILELGRLNP
jgi:hypothetical protein